MSLRADLPKALKASWVITSILAGASVIVPVVLPASAFERLLPECEAKARASRCVMCGMTTGFVLLAEGDIDGARRANAGAPVLYAGFAANFLLACAYSVQAWRKRARGDQSTCNLSR